MSIQKGSDGTPLRHQGRMLIACVTPTVKGAKSFHATSYYASTAEASEEQVSCFTALGHHLRSSISQGYVHIVGGDYNASLFPDTPQHGLFSWRSGQGSKRARPDEILVLNPTMLTPTLASAKPLGKAVHYGRGTMGMHD